MQAKKNILSKMLSQFEELLLIYITFKLNYIMIKIQFAQEITKDYALILGVSFTNVEVPHPNKYVHPKQPTLTLSLSVWNWSGYMMIYKPANIALNRHDRRRFHI